MGLMILIFLFSSQNAEASSAVSSPFSLFLLSLIHRLPEGMAVFLVRKGAHFTIYAALGFFVFFTLLPQESKVKKQDPRLLVSFLFSWLICILYAASDEIHQLFVAGRSGEFKDVLLDSCGSLCGLLAAVLLFLLMARIQRRKSRN